MTGINHAVAGSVIAVASPTHPLLAVIGAFISHFALDSLPHYGYASPSQAKNHLKVVRLDFMMIVLFLGSLAIWRPVHWELMVICSFTAMSPDIMVLPDYVRQVFDYQRKGRNFIMHWHNLLQWGERSWGMAIELPFLVIMLLVLAKLS